ncbi:MAG TPA: hypothetical protein DDY49_04100 [Paenibacillaceae bacterium]|nr:hypothetical protein [Paenibacillaceae bacterium]
MSWKHLHLWRMAFRNMLVHKQTTLLTILGALVGTALITTSLLLQHSMNHSVDQVMAQQIGNIAADVSALEQKQLQQGYFTDSHVGEMKEEIKQQGRNLLPTVATETLFMVKDPSGKPLLVGPSTYVYGFDPVLGKQFDEKAMERLPGNIKNNEVILSSPLAEQLDVKVNESVYIRDKNNQEHPFKVRAIVPEQGLTGYKGIQQCRYTAIVSLDQARQLAQMEQGYSNVLISKNDDIRENGTVLDHQKWTENSVQWKMRFYLEQNLKLLPVFTIASLNSIVIGIVLIINIFKMIGEERRREMGILRAIGLTSEDLARVLRIEGFLYAVISSVLGTVAGIGLSYLLMLKLRDLLQVIAEYEQGIMMKFTFDVDFGTLITGFVIGVLLVYLCVWFVSRKVTRLQIVEAIYGQENGTRVASGKNKSILIKVFQLFLFIFTVFLYLVTMTESYRTYVSDSPIQPVLNFLVGFILVILTVLICVVWMGKIINIITGLFRPFPKMYGTLKLAFRYPEVNKTRSGLLLTMFALVLFLTGFSGVFSKTIVQYFGNFDARKATAGYDLLAIHSGRMTSGELQEIFIQSNYIDKEKIQNGVAVQQIPIGDFNNLYINEIDETFSSHTTQTLKSRDQNYPYDPSAWMAVAKDSNVVILSSNLPSLNGETYEVGDLYPVEAYGRIVNKKIIGIADYTNEWISYLLWPLGETKCNQSICC